MANHKSNGSNRSAEPDDGPEASRVGYRNPPPETRFPPGRSGNPRGRPRGAKGHKQIVAKIANEMHPVVEVGKCRRRSTLELVLLQLRNLAAQGNVQAFRGYNDLIAKYSLQETERRLGYLVVPKPFATPEEWERVAGVKVRAYQHRLAEEASARAPCDRPSVGELGCIRRRRMFSPNIAESAAQGLQHPRGGEACPGNNQCGAFVCYRCRFDWTSSAKQASMRAWAADRLRTGSRALPRAAAGLWVVERGHRRGARIEDHPMPETNTAHTSGAQPSPLRAARRRGAKATGKEHAKQGKVAENRQRGLDHATSKPSKQQLCLEMLRRSEDACVEELQAATGWQAHSVRGFLSGTVKKKLGLTLNSNRTGDGPRRYRIRPKV